MKKQDLQVIGMLVTIIGFYFYLVVVGLIVTAVDEPEPTPTAETTIAPVTIEPLATFTATPTAAPTPTVQALNPAEVELIGRTIWGEAGGVKSKAERAAVAWCILNRVDERGQTVEQVVTAPHQFYGYRTWGECPQEHLDLAADVLTRWNAEKNGAADVGRTLPAGYLYFLGDGERNHFTQEWRSRDYWDWSLSNPYTN